MNERAEMIQEQIDLIAKKITDLQKLLNYLREMVREVLEDERQQRIQDSYS